MRTIFSFILIIVSFNSYTQTLAKVKTPNYSDVVAYITTEDEDSWRHYLDSVRQYNYPNAFIIYTYPSSGNPNIKYSSSGRFNCHGFAWYMTAGEGSGLSDPRWIGYAPDNEDEHIYWQDGSYTEIQSVDYPCVISYDPAVSDHSAISQPVPGKVVSKWADGPLMYHD